VLGFTRKALKSKPHEVVQHPRLRAADWWAAVLALGGLAARQNADRPSTLLPPALSPPVQNLHRTGRLDPSYAAIAHKAGVCVSACNFDPPEPGSASKIVAGQDARRRSGLAAGHEAFKVSFWSADWTPWRALPALARAAFRPPSGVAG
jgi:hypothetical protein